MDNSNKKQNKFVSSFKYAFAFIVAFWLIVFLQIMGFDFHTYGLLPRTETGLRGILFAPFIHANTQHLAANTLPFFVLSILLFLFYHKQALWYLLALWVTTGALTWIIGRTSWHIGASGIIYALAAFLVVGGILSQNRKLICVSVGVIVLYSGLIWGIFPGERNVSWEGHLSGAVSGTLWAFVSKKQLRKLNRNQSVKGL